ncbi:MAG: hypothetical protein KUG78_17365 [Kangiellaceae bacterium]|nr:hypothetical protein [Kangiellaceae bacterium]
MEILGIRFCSVTDDAKAELDFFENKLGLTNDFTENEGFVGGIYSTEDKSSWLECWQSAEQMPKGIMLQLIVADADAFAENAKSNGLQPHGPVDAHGERIYYLKSPSGMNMSFQSKLNN